MIADELITLRTFSSFAAAKKAVARLEKGGIKATIREDDRGGMRGRFHQTNDVKVVVRKSDAGRARDILDSKQKKR